MLTNRYDYLSLTKRTRISSHLIAICTYKACRKAELFPALLFCITIVACLAVSYLNTDLRVIKYARKKKAHEDILKQYKMNSNMCTLYFYKRKKVYKSLLYLSYHAWKEYKLFLKARSKNELEQECDQAIFCKLFFLNVNI